MELVKIRSFEEYHAYRKSTRDKRLEQENQIIKKLENSSDDYIEGFCNVCQRNTIFKHNLKGKEGFRGSLYCKHCKLNNRQRFMASFLKDHAKEKLNLNLFMYEQISRFFETVKKIDNIKLTGSEFLGFDKNPGKIVSLFQTNLLINSILSRRINYKIRHEDAMNLSFDDNLFDVIISSDVLEHIPDIDKCLEESYRVLKTPGKLLISIPFSAANNNTVRRATLTNGKIKHLLPPVFHENPMAKKDGSLVFYDYGWDFLEFIKNAGFKDAYMLAYYDAFFGHIGYGVQFIFVAEK